MVASNPKPGPRFAARLALLLFVVVTRTVFAAPPEATAVKPVRPAGVAGDRRRRGCAAPAVYGLFPLWEHTGAVEDSGAARVGMRHTQVGSGRWRSEPTLISISTGR